MTQLEKVEKYLRQNNKGKGITVAALSRVTHVPKDSVYRRVYELRAAGHAIYTNTRRINGSKKYYYRLAA